MEKIDLLKIASGCGYKNTASVDNVDDLDRELKKAKKEKDQLEKDLTEMFALYALKKKADAIWGDKEGD